VPNVSGQPPDPTQLRNCNQLTFDGGRIVADAGLLAVRALEKPLGVIGELAR
jgi:hypothetical protein